MSSTFSRRMRQTVTKLAVAAHLRVSQMCRSAHLRKVPSIFGVVQTSHWALCSLASYICVVRLRAATGAGNRSPDAQYVVRILVFDTNRPSVVRYNGQLLLCS